MALDFVVFSSYGNDSIALLQLLHEYRLPDQKTVAVLYSDTGWAAGDWADRVREASRWAESLGYFTARTEAEGFANLVLRKKMFPRGRAQFCTSELKIFPALRWLEENDPDMRVVCVAGVRRAESIRRRATPAVVPISDAHGGRMLWHPLAEFSDDDRDALIVRAGFSPLPHRSMECAPCIFSSREDLRKVPEDRVAFIAALEHKIDPSGARTMFRPKAYAGANGIREVIRWANSERGKYKPEEDDEPDCDSGFCGL